MAALFSFRCQCCGDLHEGAPSFAFAAPDQYASLSAAQKACMGTLSEDLCTITHDQGTDRFVRAILEVPILGIDEPFLWGVWVSLGEQSFRRYLETFDTPVSGDGFFGWVCNRIEVYPHAEPRPADVYVQLDGTRPKAVLHRGDPEHDPLVIDQWQGISLVRAQALAARAASAMRCRRQEA